MAIQDKEKTIKILLDEIKLGRYPETLYKYRTIERLKQVITKNSFWFSSSTHFNDPFDCSLDEVKSYQKKAIRVWLKNSPKIYNTPDFPPKAIKYFEENSNAFAELVKNLKHKAISKRGVLALSKIKNNILLWSHYADNHKGATIGIEIRKDPEFFLMPRNINYKKVYTPTNFLTNGFSSIDEILSVKSTDWEYEEEVRIYKDNEGEFKISPEAIKEISFGVNANDADISDIIDLCKSNNMDHIEFFKANKKYGEFSIEFKRIH